MTEIKDGKIKIEIKFKENSSVTKVLKKIEEAFISVNNLKTILNTFLKNIIICSVNGESKLYIKNCLNSKEENNVNKIDEFKKIYHRYITNLTNNNNFLKDYRKYLREISIRYMYEKFSINSK